MVNFSRFIIFLILLQASFEVSYSENDSNRDGSYSTRKEKIDSTQEIDDWKDLVVRLSRFRRQAIRQNSPETFKESREFGKEPAKDDKEIVDKKEPETELAEPIYPKSDLNALDPSITPTTTSTTTTIAPEPKVEVDKDVRRNPTDRRRNTLSSPSSSEDEDKMSDPIESESRAIVNGAPVDMRRRVPSQRDLDQYLLLPKTMFFQGKPIMIKPKMEKKDESTYSLIIDFTLDPTTNPEINTQPINRGEPRSADQKASSKSEREQDPSAKATENQDKNPATTSTTTSTTTTEAPITSPKPNSNAKNSTTINQTPKQTNKPNRGTNQPRTPLIPVDERGASTPDKRRVPNQDVGNPRPETENSRQPTPQRIPTQPTHPNNQGNIPQDRSQVPVRPQNPHIRNPYNQHVYRYPVHYHPVTRNYPPQYPYNQNPYHAHAGRSIPTTNPHYRPAFGSPYHQPAHPSRGYPMPGRENVHEVNFNPISRVPVVSENQMLPGRESSGSRQGKTDPFYENVFYQRFRLSKDPNKPIGVPEVVVHVMRQYLDNLTRPTEERFVFYPRSQKDKDDGKNELTDPRFPHPKFFGGLANSTSPIDSTTFRNDSNN